MSKLSKWLLNQNPDNHKHLKIVKDIDFLHISSDGRLKNMTPRIGRRQMKEEDRTIPRICGAPHLIGCMYGHSAVAISALDGDAFNGTDWVADDGSFHIYRIKGKEFIQPSKTLVPDVKETDELWVVPCSPEFSKVTPVKIGRFIPISVVNAVRLNKHIKTNHFYVEVKEPFLLKEEELAVGYHSFKIDGDLVSTNGIETPYEIKAISTSEWREALAEFNREFKARANKNKT